MLGSRLLSHRRLSLACLTGLLLMGSMNATALAQDEGKGKDKLPNAEALLQKMVKAMGGEAAMRKNKHQKLTGTFELPAQGVAADLTVHSAAPNLSLTHISIPGFGDFLSGYDGKVAWRDNPQTGPQILDGNQAEQAIEQADYYSTLNYQKNFKTIDVVGKTEFGDAECYELKLTSKSGIEQTLYINAETLRIAGSVRTVSTPQGDLEATTTIEEYKEFDGQQIATVTRSDIGGFQEQVVTITDVSFEPFDDSVFELPDSIKALMTDAPTTKPSD